MTTLRQAAQAVVDRWDAPAWSDLPTTGNCITVLRKALEAPDLYQSYIAVCEELVKRTAERDALAAAGKLALEALDLTYQLEFKTLPASIGFSDVYNKQLGARTALKQAGVK